MPSLPDLTPLLAPRSIAIVGASDRPGPSGAIFESLRRFGFAGDIFPVNPGRVTVFGLPSAPSLAALAMPPDAAVLCVGPGQVAAAVQDAAAAGVKAVVAYASGVQHTQHEGRPSIAAIQDACARAGIAFCGPDCMGVLNPASRSSLYLSAVLEPEQLVGDVGFITQSGSIAIGLLTDCRRFGFSHVISSGAEAVLNTGHYLRALADDPQTRVIALFLEAVRDMDGFLAAADHAETRGKPVIVLKVGKTDASRQAALGHTGGIAGDARVFSALLRRHGCIEVSSLEEMTETIVCLRAQRRPRREGIGVVTPSGGLVEYALDAAAQAGIALPPLAPALRDQVAAVIGPIIGTGNPIDSWGNGDFQTNLAAGLRAFAASPDHGAVVLISDSNDGQPTRITRYVDLLIEAASGSKKPFYLLSARAGLFRREIAARLDANAMAQLSGVAPALRAVSHAATWQGRVGQSRTGQGAPRPAVAADSCPDVKPGEQWLDEVAAKRFMAARGFAVPPGRLAEAGVDLAAVAAEVGFPVALKVIHEKIPHRTPYGLVALDLADAAAVRMAGTKMRERLAEQFPAQADAPLLVDRMTPSGLDLFVAASTDPECGPMLTVGLGGFLLEAIRDVVAVPLPSHEGEVAALLAESAVGRFLASAAGAAFGGSAPVIRFAEAIGDCYVAAAGRLSLIELNPVRLVPGWEDVVILDALVAGKGD